MDGVGLVSCDVFLWKTVHTGIVKPLWNARSFLFQGLRNIEGGKLGERVKSGCVCPHGRGGVAV